MVHDARPVEAITAPQSAPRSSQGRREDFDQLQIGLMIPIKDIAMPLPGRKCGGFWALALRRRASRHDARGPVRRAGEGSNLYAAFVKRGLHFLESKGMLGTITSHIGFFLASFQKWREAILLQEVRPIVYTNLEYSVLDTAMVETVIFCLEAVSRVDTA